MVQIVNKAPVLKLGCTADLHLIYGGACWHCCTECNVGHICPKCSKPVRHNNTSWTPRPEFPTHKCEVRR